MEKDFRRIGSMDWNWRNMLNAVCKDEKQVYELYLFPIKTGVWYEMEGKNDIVDYIDYLKDTCEDLQVDVLYNAEKIFALYKEKYILEFSNSTEINKFRQEWYSKVYTLGHLHKVNNNVQAKIKLIGAEKVTMKELEHFILSGKADQIF